MAVSFQEQSRRRKLLYSVIILCLFTATLLHRLNIMDPLAQKLALRQEQQGAVELTGSAFRLSLTGLRGLVVCGLWWTAIETQKKHEWNKLSALVRSVTKLQPHFITPWLFQSWNLSYNVSVENDRIRDKYFYITEGMLLLADGERKNRGYIIDTDGSPRELNHPELCFNLGFYFQQKIGTHDNQNTLMCLLQMSSIDPRERDPRRFRKINAAGDEVIDLAAFERFCKRHPMLVRRIREVLGYGTPREVVDFLATNQKLPSRFEEPTAEQRQDDPTPLKALDEQFPVVARETGTPSQLVDRDRDANPETPDFSTFSAARGWFLFANRPLPATDKTFVTEVKETYDRTRYRMPKAMAHLIFRGYPARAQDYVATLLEREGWFDAEGWPITGWFVEDPERPESPPKTVVVGEGTAWALDAWREAARKYQAYGDDTGLWLDPESMTNLENRAKEYREVFASLGDNPADQIPPEGHKLRASYEAHTRLFWYDRFRHMTNFPHFHHKTKVEEIPETVQARKAFFQAERLRRSAQSLAALEEYTKALPAWRQLLRANKEFRRDNIIQEETYETQRKYMALARTDRRPLKELKLEGQAAEDWRAPAVRHLLIFQERLAKAGTAAAVIPVHLAEIGPFDWIDDPKDPDAQPLISESARSTVESRR